MDVILFFLVPLAVVIIFAGVVDRSRRRGATAKEISAQTARAITEAKAAEHLPGGGSVGGV